MTMKNLRVAMFGAGGIAQAHAKALKTMHQVEIVGVCATDVTKAGRFINDHAAGAKPFGDCRAMLDDTRPDALYVAIPPFAHKGEVELAASRGIHLFLEKPLALSAASSRVMANAIRRAGVICQVGFMMRHGVAVRALKAMIADGSAGRPTLFQGSYQSNSLHSPWWSDRAKSGGQAFEQIIHIYDLALHLLGTATTAWGQLDNLCHQSVAGYTVEDTSIGSMRHANGALTSIAGSNCAIPMEWNSSFTVICERVTATFSHWNRAEFVHTVGSRAGQREQVSGDKDALTAETADFIESIRANRQPQVTIEEGLHTMELMQAVVDSASNSGRPTPVAVATA